MFIISLLNFYICMEAHDSLFVFYIFRSNENDSSILNRPTPNTVINVPSSSGSRTGRGAKAEAGNYPLITHINI